MLSTLEDIYYDDKVINEDSIVIPNNIGNNEIKQNRKMYIKPFEKCPICYDEIMRKTDAYLTSCGHGFHKKCLFKAYEVKQKMKAKSNFKCPCCRSNLGMDVEEINDKYDVWNGNEMDNLENFWIKKDFILPHICRNNYDHWYGMNKNCSQCKEYWKTGSL